jgi:hypothetical protein
MAADVFITVSSTLGEVPAEFVLQQVADDCLSLRRRLRGHGGLLHSHGHPAAELDEE